MKAQNPFQGDPDRGPIWDMLVARDIAAFVAGDWGQVSADFHEDGFSGIRGANHPDQWTIAYPTLAAYAKDWLAHSKLFNNLVFRNERHLDFLHRATALQEIEITGDRAIAHKKFKGVAALANGDDYSLDWQTLYFLRCTQGNWRIPGFVGYLPHPFPARGAKAAIEAVAGSAQHITAGPYSPVLKITPGVIVAISGQGPIDPIGRIIGSAIVEQTRATLDNCVKQLTSAGARLSDVFQVKVYLSSMQDWDAFNDVYREYMQPPFPVRTAIEAKLWGGILVEVDMMANLVAQ